MANQACEATEGADHDADDADGSEDAGAGTLGWGQVGEGGDGDGVGRGGHGLYCKGRLGFVEIGSCCVREAAFEFPQESKMSERVIALMVFWGGFGGSLPRGRDFSTLMDFRLRHARSDAFLSDVLIVADTGVAS